MKQPPQPVLVLGAPPDGLAATAWGPFVLRPCADLDAVAAAMAAGGAAAVLLDLPDADAARGLADWPGLPQLVLGAAVLVLTEAPTLALLAPLLERGVQDLLPRAIDADALGRALQAAIARQALVQEARRSWSTDLATGLPNQAQLLEHMNHLLALREREPAPMALLVVRIEGLLAAQTRLGSEAVGVLRRKLAVRLRAALRASDVVASLGADAFAVLLAWIDAPSAAVGVAAKLERTLTHKPLQVGASMLEVGVRIGASHYPVHGRDAGALLRLALSEAAGAPAHWRTTAAAANDEPM